MSDEKIRNAKHLVEAFENKSLAKTDWNHQAHLVVAFWYSYHYEPEKAFEKIKKNIIAYNEHVGTPNTETSGYHETLTRFWMMATHQFLELERNEPLEKSYENFLAWLSKSKDFPLKFYNKNTLFSARARRGYMAPDLQEFRIDGNL